MDCKTLTVTQLNNRIKELFELDPMLASVSVHGELSNYKIYPSGHHYFTLKDSESSIRCVMFKSSAAKLRFTPESGMSVTVFGRVSVYPRDGAYQLYCNALIPEGTGDLQIAFEQLKDKLSKENLFSQEHKKALPEFPARIAIVTSAAGAAVHDMIRILGRRWPMAKVLLLPVRVQGVEAPMEIVGAIKYANEFKIADLIITGRGGGSIEDLWAFNDERVARAIYESELPVISAVGHEPDVTIADYVADSRASTPSNAAEIAVPDSGELRDELRSYEIRANQAIRKTLNRLSEKLDNYSSHRVLTDPTAYIDNKRLEMDRMRDNLAAAGELTFAGKRRGFVKLAATLDAMSPLRVLGRGYTITSDLSGKTLRSVKELNIGDALTLGFLDGTADCTVSNISEN